MRVGPFCTAPREAASGRYPGVQAARSAFPSRARHLRAHPFSRRLAAQHRHCPARRAAYISRLVCARTGPGRTERVAWHGWRQRLWQGCPSGISPGRRQLGNHLRRVESGRTLHCDQRHTEHVPAHLGCGAAQAREEHRNAQWPWRALSRDGLEPVWADDLVAFSTSDWHVIRRLKGVLVEGNKFSAIPNPWQGNLLLHDMAYVPGTHTLVFGGGQYEKNTDACGPVAYPYTPYAGRVWILKSGATALSVADSFVAYCPPKGGDVQFLAFSPDGQQIATVTGIRAAKPGSEPVANTKILSFPNGRLIATPILNAKTNVPTGLVYTGDGRYLLVGDGGIADKEHAVFIVDAQTMQLLDTVHAPPAIGDIAVAPDSTMFAVATGTGVTVWKFVHP